MFSLKGRVAVVTGGAGALGLGIAESLLALGADVALVGRSRERLDAAVSQLATQGLQASAHACDVADEKALQDVRDALLARSGKLDILVTCAAGPAAAGKFEEMAFDDWRALMATDLDGVFLACKVFGSAMLASQYGRIINLTSFHNVATYPFRTVYNAAKSGVEGLSRALAVEWGHQGITVNTVAPGPILTPRTRWFLSQNEANEAGMLGRTPNVRLGEVEDVGSAVAFLASEEARHINGQQLVIDGGWSKNAWWGRHTEL